MRYKSGTSATSISRQRGTSVLEYTLMMGIVATVGISAIRIIGGAIAGDTDPCNPGVLIKVARILGEQRTLSLNCEHPPTP